MPFYYTGCNGNKNNFESRDACESDCPPKIGKILFPLIFCPSLFPPLSPTFSISNVIIFKNIIKALILSAFLLY